MKPLPSRPECFWMGVIAGVIATLALPTPAKAACESQHVGLITISRHINPGREYNEEHYGPYWRCDRGGPWSWQAGFYRNSLDRTTVYGLVNYVPWEFGPPDLRLKLGSSFGLGTGYAEHSDGRPSSGLSPIIGGLAVVEIDRRAHAGVFFNTAVVAAIIEYRF